MSDSGKRYSLFEVFGVELEYMIVDKTTMDVKPLCDLLMKEAAGEIVADYEVGAIAWSNELVNHVVELKTNGPAAALQGLDEQFHSNVIAMNRHLDQFNAMLLPGGAHPWMNPFVETQLWQHDFNAIYDLYNRIFDCRGHGWSNLQSTHINLPFANDEEFGRLHAAIRLILPLIPALCASTPIMDGKLTGFADSRLEAYRHNQKKIPSIAGRIIPEQVFTEADYYAQIFDPIRIDIQSYDKEGILKHHFLNSRGAIARFDRGAIEIRLIDIQECPKADLAILETIVAVLKMLVNEVTTSYDQQKEWDRDVLADLLKSTIRNGESTIIDNADYLKIFGLNKRKASASVVWQSIIGQTRTDISDDGYDTINRIVNNGTLSSRIVSALGSDYSPENLHAIYSKLAVSLHKNELFNCRV